MPDWASNTVIIHVTVACTVLYELGPSGIRQDLHLLSPAIPAKSQDLRGCAKSGIANGH